MNKTRRAGVFDIRVVIAAMIGLYGAVTTIMGIGFTSAEDIEKSAGLNINLWAGIGMLVVAAAFLLWARWRPVKVPDSPEDEAGTE